MFRGLGVLGVVWGFFGVFLGWFTSVGVVGVSECGGSRG